MSYKRPPAIIAYDERMPDGTTRLRVRDDRRIGRPDDRRVRRGKRVNRRRVEPVMVKR